MKNDNLSSDQNTGFHKILLKNTKLLGSRKKTNMQKPRPPRAQFISESKAHVVGLANIECSCIVTSLHNLRQAIFLRNIRV